jgi:hypothetical protein
VLVVLAILLATIPALAYAITAVWFALAALRSRPITSEDRERALMRPFPVAEQPAD